MLKLRKHLNFCFIYESDLKPSEELFDRCAEFMSQNSQVGVMAPLIHTKQGSRIHNYRNFPSFVDLVIKNFKVLRTRFANRMRRYLLWDLKMDSVSNVDFVTSEFMCVRNEVFEPLQKLSIQSNFFDLKLCALAWQMGLEVAFNPMIKFQSCFQLRPRSLTSKLGMLVSSIGLQKLFWIDMHGIDFPSKNYNAGKQMLMNAHRINSRSYLSGIGSRFQPDNSVVQVFEGKVDGNFSYKQPLIFCYDGVIAVLKNNKNEYGLIKIWRHAPLKQSVPNLFPVFPDTQDLGVYSFECVRGGGEKYDSDLEISILRELEEEINLTQKNIKSIRKLSAVVGNTAWDVGRSYVFVIEVDGDFEVKLQKSESIESFAFYSRAQILEMLRDNQIICGLTRAALLEDILAYD